MRIRWTIATSLKALLLTLLLAPTALHAEPTAGERATADALFRDAKRLMKKKAYDEACPKLAESQRLDPQGGTLLNLAVCHALQGLTASAWVEFQEALALAKEAKRRDRIHLAEREIVKLEPRLSRLTIQVPETARVEEIVLSSGTVEKQEPEEVDENDESAEAARQMKVGNWIEFIDENGNRERAKLSWISPISSRYLFVNRRGLKVCDKSVAALAVELRRGTAILLEEVPLFDRALDAIVERLRQTHSAGDDAAPAADTPA